MTEMSVDVFKKDDTLTSHKATDSYGHGNNLAMHREDLK